MEHKKHGIGALVEKMEHAVTLRTPTRIPFLSLLPCQRLRATARRIWSEDHVVRLIIITTYIRNVPQLYQMNNARHAALTQADQCHVRTTGEGVRTNATLSRPVLRDPKHLKIKMEASGRL
jgi:hypothetical protein